MEINAANFPDEIFRNYVSSNFDTDKDGRLSENEIAAVTTIDVSGKGISSLTGIKYFTALTELHCENTKLTGADLTGLNDLTALTCNFKIDSSETRIMFNIAEFMNAYKSLDDSVLYVDFRFHFENGRGGSVTVDPDIIAMNNTVSFPIPAGETFETLSYIIRTANTKIKTFGYILIRGIHQV